ncbi:hypothetical protein LWI28_028019 [Acer negundo]|uniref:Reverse transcriptase zinc-binding domain-containing protein n=1 Tax=Acer negundo TaxID=4023 RepID=A0AAD5J717_ACENE|nr:hypothetical protein LWI28_028019 [Acer negundo]
MNGQIESGGCSGSKNINDISEKSNSGRKVVIVEEVKDVEKEVEGVVCGNGFAVLFDEGEHSQIRLKDLVIDNVWDVEELQRLLGSEKADEVMGRVGQFRNFEDVILWLHKKDGCFNTKYAWDVVRVRLPKFGVDEKVAFNCLSVDEKVKSLGVPIVSACNCCSSKGIEDLDHILNNGDFASNLWRKVFAEVGVSFLAHRSWRRKSNSGLIELASIPNWEI